MRKLLLSLFSPIVLIPPQLKLPLFKRLIHPKTRYFLQVNKTKPTLSVQKALAPVWEHLITLTMASREEGQ